MNFPRRNIEEMIAAPVRPCTTALAPCYSLKFRFTNIMGASK